jgi:hypothetical protein
MTAEPALKLVTTDEVETKALDIVGQAKAVKVTDQGSYLLAGLLWKEIGDMMKEVKDTFDPICEAAHRAHKAATEKRAKYLDPLAAAQKSVKALMSAWDAEQERIRREEQRRLEEEARKAAEEQALLDAIAAEEEAKRNGATAEEAAREAEAVISEPVHVPPVVLPKATPKLAGGPVYRIIWRAEVTDMKALISAVARGAVSINAVLPNDAFLRQQAESLKETADIPGVRVYSQRV